VAKGDDAGSAGPGSFVARVFDAPRELVFKAWTEPERLKHWWGPKGFTTPFCAVDLREGGVFLYCMRSPEGRDFWGRGVYREIVVPERLVLVMSFADAEGNVVPATYYGLGPDWPLESLTTVTFEEFAGATTVTVRDEGVPPGPEGDALGRAGPKSWTVSPNTSQRRERPRQAGGAHEQTDEKGTATMKLTVNTNVSVDGVMQGLGGPEEDRRDGFERGGWAMPHSDSETMALIGEVYQRADAFLFGRRTYEVFAGSWGAMADSDDPIAAALNTRPKYVASTTLTDPRWAETTVLTGDVAAAVGELKARSGGELQMVGSLSVVRLLLDNDLVDELTLFTFPVVVGQGRRLFPDSGLDLALELVESRATAGGVTMQVYRTAGRPQYGEEPPPT
jgi:uncharacterized protein YndB with AHSA1/START domain/dihydrofolate reductase